MYGSGTGTAGTLVNINARVMKFGRQILITKNSKSTKFLGEILKNHRDTRIFRVQGWTQLERNLDAEWTQLGRRMDATWTQSLGWDATWTQSLGWDAEWTQLRRRVPYG